MQQRDQESASDARVLLVAASNRRRGAEVFTTQLAGGLHRFGWEVSAVALTGSSDSATVPLAPLVTVDSADVGRFDTSIRAALRAEIERVEPAVVVAMGGSTLRYAVLAAGRKHRTVYFAIGEPEYWYRSALAKWLNRWLLRRVDCVIAVSEMTARQLVDLAPSLASRMSVAHTGVASEFFGVERSDAENGLRVVFVGSLSTEKDPLLAVEAVAATPDAQLRLVGGGPLSGEVEATIGRLGLTDRIEMIGASDDVATHLEWADVLLLTSRTEGLPGVVLEAAASGIPTVAVDVGGLREAVVDGVTGIVVEREVPCLVEALVQMSRHPEDRARMGVAARDRAVREFTLEAAFERFDEILRQVIR